MLLGDCLQILIKGCVLQSVIEGLPVKWLFKGCFQRKIEGMPPEIRNRTIEGFTMEIIKRFLAELDEGLLPKINKRWLIGDFFVNDAPMPRKRCEITAALYNL